MFEEEIWKETSISSDYEVSNHGRFRSLTRTVSVMSGYKKVLEGKDLKPFDVHTTGYLQIKIRGKKYAAHRIVAMAFCDGYAHGLVVNHKNGNKKITELKTLNGQLRQTIFAMPIAILVLSQISSEGSVRITTQVKR